MPEIPLTSALAYVGVFFLISGFFLIATGLKILKIENITVTPGIKTWRFGILLVALGTIFLIPNIKDSFTPPDTLTTSNSSQASLSQLPTKFDDVRSAELHISEIDDYLYISVNGENLQMYSFSQTPDPISITRLLKRGTNNITIRIDNSNYGGCGARVELWLNGVTNNEYQWYWFKDIDKAPSQGNCFTVVKTLYLP